MKALWLSLPLLVLSAGCCTGGESAPGAAGQASAWRAAETNGAGTPAVWKLTDEAAAGRVVAVATENGGHTYNLYLSDALYGPDLELITQLRADGGEEDRGGGVVWRARDANNYYVTRWNPLENNLRIYKVVDGKRTQLASLSAEVAPTGWHDLNVSMRGASILVRLDALTLGVEDTTFGEAGRVGLWTKADAATSFLLPQAKTLAR